MRLICLMLLMTITPACSAPITDLSLLTRPAPAEGMSKATIIKLYTFITKDNYHKVRRTLLKQKKNISHDILMKLLLTAVEENALKTASILVNHYKLNPFEDILVLGAAECNNQVFKLLYYLYVWFPQNIE